MESVRLFPLWKNADFLFPKETDRFLSILVSYCCSDILLQVQGFKTTQIYSDTVLEDSPNCILQT